MAKQVKTNVMRILDQHHIVYKIHTFAKDGSKTILPIFKTLVTVAKSKQHYVFVVPINKTLDLKLAAKAVNEKAIEMIKEKELLPLTGYVHGGCSPIGMKKQFQTVIDETAQQFATIIFSAGKVGYSVEVSLEQLLAVIPYQLAPISKDKA